jgi:hypothetical protein
MARITLSNNELRLISQALDLYARIGAAHFEVILDHPGVHHISSKRNIASYKTESGDQTTLNREAYFLARDAAADLLYAVKKIITGKNLGRGGNLGIHNDILHESCREAYDMHQVIRHALWKIDPERSLFTVDSSVSKTSNSATELIQVIPDE